MDFGAIPNEFWTIFENVFDPTIPTTQRRPPTTNL